MKLNKKLIIKGFYQNQLKEALFNLIEILKQNNIRFTSPISLPNKKKIYCVLTSPHVNKDAREHFEIRTYRKIIFLEIEKNYYNIFNKLLFNLPFLIQDNIKYKNKKLEKKY